MVGAVENDFRTELTMKCSDLASAYTALASMEQPYRVVLVECSDDFFRLRGDQYVTITLIGINPVFLAYYSRSYKNKTFPGGEQ